MKVIVNMACGLANRMFQYSYYLFLKHKGYNVKVDFYNSAKLAHEKVSWNDIFPKAKIKQASFFDVFLNSATHIVRNKFKILSNNILPSILPCQKIHLT